MNLSINAKHVECNHFPWPSKFEMFVRNAIRVVFSRPFHKRQRCNPTKLGRENFIDKQLKMCAQRFKDLYIIKFD